MIRFRFCFLTKREIMKMWFWNAYYVRSLCRKKTLSKLSQKNLFWKSRLVIKPLLAIKYCLKDLRTHNFFSTFFRPSFRKRAWNGSDFYLPPKGFALQLTKVRKIPLKILDKTRQGMSHFCSFLNETNGGEFTTFLSSFTALLRALKLSFII